LIIDNKINKFNLKNKIKRLKKEIILKEIYYVPNNNEFIGLKKTLNSVIIKYYIIKKIIK
jgi:hypothetical protein